MATLRVTPHLALILQGNHTLETARLGGGHLPLPALRVRMVRANADLCGERIPVQGQWLIWIYGPKRAWNFLFTIDRRSPVQRGVA